MPFDNLTDPSFWDAKYRLARPRYFPADPLYGRRGLLAGTVRPILGEARDVLELGCGSSRFMMFFNMAAGLETYGLDFSRTGLEKLEAMSRPHGVKHHLFYGDMFVEDLESRKFDVVFHSGLVEHFTDLDRFFTRCRFFCRDKGLMLFLMPNMQNRAWGWHKRICPENYQAHIRYTATDIERALKGCFTNVTIRSWGYPQLYAGGPPESKRAYMMKYLNLGLIFLISYLVPGYRGRVGPSVGSHWLFTARAKEV